MQRNSREHPANQQAALLADLLRAQGQTLWEIANKLNAVGYRTRRGKAFHATTVQRLLVTSHHAWQDFSKKALHIYCSIS